MGTAVCHLTSVHPRFDHRVFEKELRSLSLAGYETSLVVADGDGDAVVEGIEIYDAGKRPAGRLMRILWGAFSVTRCAREQKADIFHLHDPELLIHAWLLRRRGQKVIYDAHENLGQQVLHKEWIPGPLRRFVAGVASKAMSLLTRLFCDGIVCATPVIERTFSGHLTRCVCNFPRTELFPTTASDGEREAGKRDPFHVVYVGGLSGSRGVFSMLDAVAHLPQEGFRFSLAGPMESEALSLKLEAHKGWNRINYLGVIEREQVFRLLQEAELGVVLLQPVPAYVDALPVKMFEYMAAGLPVLASDFVEWKELLKGFDCAEFVEPSSDSQMADRIQSMAADRERLALMKAESLRASRERFCWAREEEKLLSLYSEIKQGSDWS